MIKIIKGPWEIAETTVREEKINSLLVKYMVLEVLRTIAIKNNVHEGGFKDFLFIQSKDGLFIWLNRQDQEIVMNNGYFREIIGEIQYGNLMPSPLLQEMINIRTKQPK